MASKLLMVAEATLTILNYLFTFFSIQVRCTELMEQAGIRGMNAEKRNDLKGLQEIMSFMISEIKTFGVVFKSSRHVETIKASIEGADVIGHIKVTNKQYITAESREILLKDDFGSLYGGATCLKRSISQPDISLSGYMSMRPVGEKDTSVTNRLEPRPIQRGNISSINRHLAKDPNEFTTVGDKTAEICTGSSGDKKSTVKVQPNVGYVSPMQLSTCSSRYSNDSSHETSQGQRIATRLREIADPQRDVNISTTNNTPSNSAGMNRGTTEQRQTESNTTNEQGGINRAACNPIDQTVANLRPRTRVPPERYSDTVDNINELDLETLLRTRSQTGSSFLRTSNSSNVGQTVAEKTGYTGNAGNADRCQTQSSDNETTEPSNAADESITRVKQVHNEQERDDDDNMEETADQDVAELRGTEIMTLKSTSLQNDTSITQVKVPITERPSEQSHTGLANYKRFTSSQVPLGDNWSFLSESMPIDSIVGTTSERDILISRSSSSEESDLSSIA